MIMIIIHLHRENFNHVFKCAVFNWSRIHKKEEKKGPILKVRLTPIEVPHPQLLNHKLVCIVF